MSEKQPSKPRRPRQEVIRSPRTQCICEKSVENGRKELSDKARQHQSAGSPLTHWRPVTKKKEEKR